MVKVFMEFLTCQVMYGNGYQIGMVIPIIKPLESNQKTQWGQKTVCDV